MALPDNFSPVEHFQDSIGRIYNKEVKDWFSDLDPDELGIDTPRSSLRTACWHQENDSVMVTVGRMLLFDMVVARKVQGSGSDIYQVSRHLPVATIRRRGAH